MIPVPPAAGHPDARFVIYAKDQPQYTPLPAYVDPKGLVLCEFEFTAEELAAVLAGGRVRAWIWTFNRALQPVMLEVVS